MLTNNADTDRNTVCGGQPITQVLLHFLRVSAQMCNLTKQKTAQGLKTLPVITADDSVRRKQTIIVTSFRIYFLTLLISLTNIAYGQSKDCRSVYYKPGPTVKCSILPLKKINDTVICTIPKNCNDIRFDSTANGHWKVFSNDTVTLLQTIDFRNGLRHGQSIYYFDNKKIQTKQNYVHGKLRGDEIIYNEAGQITEKGSYDDKERFNGTVTQYWDNGKIASIQDWKNGWYFGDPKYWDNKGNLIDKKTFEKLWYDCK